MIWKWQISHCGRVAVEKPSEAMVVGRSLGNEVLLRKQKLSNFLLFSANSENLGAIYHEILSRANPYHVKQLTNPHGWQGTKILTPLISDAFNLQLTSGATLTSNLKPHHLQHKLTHRTINLLSPVAYLTLLQFLVPLLNP